MAIAVGPDVEYVTVHVDEDLDSPVAGQDVVIAKDLLGSYARELGEDPQVLAACTGADLVGRRYHPIFDYFDDAAHRAEGAAPRAEGLDDHRRRLRDHLRRNRPGAHGLGLR